LYNSCTFSVLRHQFLERAFAGIGLMMRTYHGCDFESVPAPELLFDAENRVLCDLCDSEFESCFGRNLDLQLRLGIKARARFPLLFNQLAKARQDEFAILPDLFVRECAERIEKYSGGSFV